MTVETELRGKTNCRLGFCANGVRYFEVIASQLSMYLIPRGMIKDGRTKSRLIQPVNFPINRLWMSSAAHFHFACTLTTIFLSLNCSHLVRE